MIDTLNFARMIQKFVDKKKSVGYSHPPTMADDRAAFHVMDHTGRKFQVTVQEITMGEELALVRQ